MQIRSPRVTTAARVLAAAVVCAPALWLLAVHARSSASRLRYPIDIEWLEGPLLYQAYRFMHGLGALGAPDHGLEHGYLPPFHPPGFPFVLSLVGRIFGLSYAVGRAVSLVAFVSSLALIARGLARHVDSRLDAWMACLLATGCAVAGAPLVSGFYDLVRDDMTAMAFCVLAATLADVDRRAMTTRRIAALALIYAAAVFTRVNTVFFLTWVTLYVFARHRRTGVLLALASLGAGALVLVGLQFASKGWYWIYAVAVSQSHPVFRDRAVEGVRHILWYASFAPAVFVLALALAVTRRLTRRSVLWVGMLVAAVPASLLPFAKRGGFYNDFLPLALLLGPTTLFLAFDAVRALRAHPRAASAVRWCSCAAISVFLLGKARQPWLDFDSRSLAPSAAYRRDARAFVDRLAQLQGGFIAPRGPFLGARSGIARQLSDMPYMDLAWARWPIPDVGGYIDSTGARWAILSGNEEHATAAPIAQRYQLETTLAGVPPTLFGDYVELRYVLRKEESSPSAHVVFDFERPLDGWTLSGDAFARSPTTLTPDWQQAIEGASGHGVANSYHPSKKDGATGRMTSPPFVIDRPHLALRIGGGTRDTTRAELRVDGNTVAKASPIFDEMELMIRVVWDVSSLQGREARLVLVDEDTGSWGHITCDDVTLY